MKPLSIIAALSIFVIGGHIIRYVTNTAAGISALDADKFLDCGIKEYSFKSFLKNVEGSHDPRVMPSIWLEALAQELFHNDELFDSEFGLPFRWSSWLDLDRAENWKCRYLQGADADCCNQVDGIVSPIDRSFSEITRNIIGASYLAHQGSVPERVLFLSGDGNDSLAGIIVPTCPSGILDRNLLLNKYNLEHLDYLILNEKAKKVNELIREITTSISFIDDNLMKRDKIRIKTAPDFLLKDNLVSLAKSEFIFDVNLHIEDSSKSLAQSLSTSSINDFDSDVLSMFTGESINGDNAKYFHEANLINSGKGSHFDWRFFRTTKMSTYERQVILHRMARVWFKFAKLSGVKSWLGHGTLLGWYWNGFSFPWDDDMDVQISIEGLYKLSRNYNQTFIVDITDGEGKFNIGMGQYFLDIGSHIFERDKQKGNNVIDARLIDVRSGLYIDITALSFTQSAKALILQDKNSEEEFKKVLMNYAENDLSKQMSYEQFCETRALLWNSQALFNCKNNHFYTMEEVGTLIMTTFEGIQCFVPIGFEKILEREYGEGFRQPWYGGWRFRDSIWEKAGRRKGSKETHSELKQTNSMTEIHEQEMKYLNQTDNLPIFRHVVEEIGSFRIDPWIIKQSLQAESY
ncbi:hypothetical protein CLIB1423_01S07910 [[Candida] railenensis]|uniref:LicD/FKTN/FKRP nucleotidyltransferase domain-containing protein n=1 Tax=[Candida] railenensis TaxID=45579 RepID=A0A9P0QKS7_9ASCO|nr:hypothetical protein CLIB1423_01S07910 [[Candida] railenensis]